MYKICLYYPCTKYAYIIHGFNLTSQINFPIPKNIYDLIS